MELGGNIKLAGFEEIEPAKLVVIKKIVGNYVKNFGSVRELNLSLNKDNDDNFKIVGSLKLNDKEKNAEIEGSNLFFVLNNLLNKLKEE